eukprot:22399-Eustigmatos_ZCMA.PRE.1
MHVSGDHGQCVRGGFHVGVVCGGQVEVCGAGCLTTFKTRRTKHVMLERVEGQQSVVPWTSTLHACKQ